MYHHLSSTIMKRVVTSSSGEHHLRIAGFKFKRVCAFVTIILVNNFVVYVSLGCNEILVCVHKWSS